MKTVETKDKLTAFLFLLMRDHITLGEMDRLLVQVRGPSDFKLDHRVLADYAQVITGELRPSEAEATASDVTYTLRMLGRVTTRYPSIAEARQAAEAHCGHPVCITPLPPDEQRYYGITRVGERERVPTLGTLTREGGQ